MFSRRRSRSDVSGAPGAGAGGGQDRPPEQNENQGPGRMFRAQGRPPPDAGPWDWRWEQGVCSHARRWRVSKRFSLPRDMLPYERYGSREDNHAVGTIDENGLGGAQSSADEMVPRLTSSIRTTPALVTKRNIEPIIVRRSPYELDRGGFPMREIGIVERAYQLAREGKSLGEVRPQLSRDGFSLAEIEAHLAGPYLRAALRTLATKARAQVALDEADMGSGLLDRLSQVDGALVVGAHTSGDAGSGNMPTVHPAHTHERKAVRAAGDELSAPIRP
jgi:hypothetical protein